MVIKDQAAELRALVDELPASRSSTNSTRQGRGDPFDFPRRGLGAITDSSTPALIAVIGARSGVGATTVARHLMESVQQTGRVASLVDPITNGIAGTGTNLSPPVETTKHFREPGRRSQVVVADLSGGASVTDERLLTHARRVVLVSTPDVVVLMDAYAKLKAHRRWLNQVAVELVINRTDDEDVAQRAFERLHRSCARFLRIDIEYLGAIAPTQTGKAFKHEAHSAQLKQNLRQVGIAFLRHWR